MEFLDAPIRRLAAFTEADTILKRSLGPVQLSGCVESQKVQMMSRAGGKPVRLAVTYDERAARALLEDFLAFGEEAYFFPGKDLLFYQADMRSGNIARDRMKVFRRFSEPGAFTVVTTVQALMNRTVPEEVFSESVLTLSEGGTAELPALRSLLVSMGYVYAARVEQPGEFSVQGGILDLFDLTSETPYRIEFWDDEIDTIRTFHPESQLSLDRVPEITVYPATELVLSRKMLEEGRKRINEDYQKTLSLMKEKSLFEAAAALQELFRNASDEMDDFNLQGTLERFLPYFYKKTASLTDYLPNDTLILLDEPQRMYEYAEGLQAEFEESFKMRLPAGLALPGMAGIMAAPDTVFEALSTPRTLAVTGLDVRLPMLKIRNAFRIDCQSMISYQGNFEGLLTDLKRFLRMKYSVVLLSPSRTRASRMAEELREFGLRAYFDEGASEVAPGDLLVAHGNLHRGFIYPQLKFVVLTEGDIFGSEKRKKRRKNVPDGQKIRTFSELSPGDYVVHENYGIGIYRGIEKIEREGAARDYMKISYGDSGTLYIPVTNLDVVQKYASKEAKPPRISRLDSPEWSRTKGRVKAAVEEVAEELVALYAERMNGEGFRFGPDTVWQKEFEELFPFEETEDQLNAIADTKADMESSRIMDRLICGDVGFGKTEVALRAAFKAVQDDKQVAVLVPTTILAQQHYNTFIQRMQDYPVNIGMLSRFRTPSEQKETLRDLARGAVDIVIGTHRLLSKDVQFKNLGLLVVDEEQRFGVTHKEKIKQMKKNVDVLTLTATPIPRTMHMSMIGVRDMSLLSEPPTDRQAIQTYVMEYNEQLVREAIQRELNRGGQVYYVYNRVLDIEDVRAKVQALVPDAVVASAHGKMTEHKLEQVMLSFIEGEIDVLVSTTIIETGLDIPNVNTIIVHDAERYGLSQLYQLRGRVGRSGRQAYAFIMYRKNRVPNEEAEKRLEAIRQFTELGSGIRIAMQDLEIRGAGTLLGNAQSGHMALVGYDLYCKLLSEAIREKKGDTPSEDPYAGMPETLLDLRTDAHIPESYIGSETVRLEIYKKISLITGDEDVKTLTDELVDRFGEPPSGVKNLMEAACVRAIAHSLYMTEIKGGFSELTFTFYPKAAIRTEGIPELVHLMNGAMRFRPQPVPSLLWQRPAGTASPKEPLTSFVKSMLLRIKELLI